MRDLVWFCMLDNASGFHWYWRMHRNLTVYRCKVTQGEGFKAFKVVRRL